MADLLRKLFPGNRESSLTAKTAREQAVPAGMPEAVAAANSTELGRELMNLAPERPLAAARARELLSLSGRLLETPEPVALTALALDGFENPDVKRARYWTYGQKLLKSARYVCVIGVFDGVHLGHQELLLRAARDAAERGDKLAVLTFTPDPADVLTSPAPSSKLLSDEGRVSALLSFGEDADCPDVSSVVCVDFDSEFASLSWAEFAAGALGLIFGDEFEDDFEAVFVGSDFRFGAHGEGDLELLEKCGDYRGFDVTGVELLEQGGAPVTATRIRGLVHAGRVEEAAGLLSRPHMVVGTVEHGRGEGASFGFPTANIVCDFSACVPEQGVYAGFVTVADEDGALSAYPAAINVGLPPSFKGEAPEGTLLEANLIGFDGDLYGSKACVSFVRWLRDSRPFATLEELERTVLENIDWTGNALGGRGIRIN